MIDVNRFVSRRVWKLREHLCRCFGALHSILLVLRIVLELIGGLGLDFGLGGRRREEVTACCQSASVYKI